MKDRVDLALELGRARAALAFKQGLIEDISRDCAKAEAAVERVEALADRLDFATDPGPKTADAIRAALAGPS